MNTTMLCLLTKYDAKPTDGEYVINTGGGNNQRWDPCLTPRPFCWRLSIDGTTTAGVTAAITNPSMNPQSSGKSRIRYADTAAVTASTRQGRNAKRTTLQDSFLSATGSNPKPAWVKITTNATFLQTNQTVGGIRSMLE